jgi:hypothetical protein
MTMQSVSDLAYSVGGSFVISVLFSDLGLPSTGPLMLSISVWLGYITLGGIYGAFIGYLGYVLNSYIYQEIWPESNT